MKIVIAPDSFKGGLSAKQAALSMKKGIERVTDCETVLIPMADGGEGTSEAISEALGAEPVKVSVLDALGRETTAEYHIGDDCAIMEMSAASGIMIIPNSELNPLKASTFGTGQLILDAISKGVKRIIIGIGGSATNDGGMGMATALGVKFFDKNGCELVGCGENTEKIASIDTSGINPKIKETEIKVACDVTNTICGKNGATYMFGPQKGVTKDLLEKLDNGLENYVKKIYESTGKDLLTLKGGGAAGGLGVGLVAFTGAKLEKGFDIVAEAVGLEDRIKGADLVLTGEGSTDRQTAFGKLPSGVGKIAKKYNVPCVIISGAVKGDISPLYDCGITAAFSTLSTIRTLEEAINNAAIDLENATENVVRIFYRR